MERYQIMANLRQAAITAQNYTVLHREDLKVVYSPDHVQYNYYIKLTGTWYNISESLFMTEL